MPPEKSGRRLGRGLDALFNSAASREQPLPNTQLRDLPITAISPNPFQPRKEFSETELRELQESISTNGLLQPVTVRATPGGKGFELVAGERRLRAVRNLGWKEIPAVVKEISDREMLTLALVENLQRFDLNPVEEAAGYERLVSEFGYTQLAVAELVGKDRSTIANAIRILQLPEPVRALIQQGRLTQGQCRPLLAIGDTKKTVAFARQIIEHGWSAREVERRVRDLAGITPASKPRSGKGSVASAEVRDVEQALRKHLQTDVSVQVRDENRGSITIQFYSPDDLERVLELMGVRNPH
jgi:ParB family chromosome partitioning protein